MLLAVHIIILLGAIVVGARMGSIAIGFAGGLGLAGIAALIARAMSR